MLATVCPLFFFFFFNDTATTEIYTLSLHDALPIFDSAFPIATVVKDRLQSLVHLEVVVSDLRIDDFQVGQDRKSTRLNSSHSQISYAVFCLKKKKITTLIQLQLIYP